MLTSQIYPNIIPGERAFLEVAIRRCRHPPALPNTHEEEKITNNSSRTVTDKNHPRCLTSDLLNLSDPTILRVLPTMTVRAFRMKVTKSLKIPKAQQGSLRLWLRMPDGWISELTASSNFADQQQRDSYDLSWYGLENGSEVILYVGSPDA